MPFGARCSVTEKAGRILTSVMPVNGSAKEGQQKQAQTNQGAKTRSAMMDEPLEDH
jgi:hypothetical protein